MPHFELILDGEGLGPYKLDPADVLPDAIIRPEGLGEMRVLDVLPADDPEDECAIVVVEPVSPPPSRSLSPGAPSSRL